MIKQRILVLGVTGMLGHVLFNHLAEKQNLDVFGTARDCILGWWFNERLLKNIYTGVDAENIDSVRLAIAECNPDIVVNCIGIIKQSEAGNDPLPAISINAMLPHVVARICAASGARLIHFSTDCVFDGNKGNYSEEDEPNATDLYGRTKVLGELNYPNTLTIRTSIIGNELKNRVSLVEWFLAQKGEIKGYKKVLFSGLPSIELAEIIECHIINNNNLEGLYHLSAQPISKYDLLKLIAAQYQKAIDIKPDEYIILDRSLNSTRFRKTTGYQPASWPELVNKMYKHYLNFGYNQLSE